MWLSRAERVRAVRDAGADLLLSLHFNDLPERDVTLVETYYAHASNIVDSRTRRRSDAGPSGAATAVDPDEPADVSFTRGSERFAAQVQRRVLAVVREGRPAAIDAGVKRDTLFVLTRGATSGALIELTCLSNPAEALRLAGDAYRERLVGALVAAIDGYRLQSNLVVPPDEPGDRSAAGPPGGATRGPGERLGERPGERPGGRPDGRSAGVSTARPVIPVM